MVVVIDKGNCGTAELLFSERVLSGLKVFLFWINVFDDGGDHSEIFLVDVVVLTGQLPELLKI